MINRDSRGHLYSNDRGEILGPFEDKLLRKHLPRMFSLIKNERLHHILCKLKTFSAACLVKKSRMICQGQTLPQC